MLEAWFSDCRSPFHVRLLDSTLLNENEVLTCNGRSHANPPAYKLTGK